MIPSMTSPRHGPIAMVACSLALVWPATCTSQHETQSVTGDTGFETMPARDLSMLRGEDPRHIHFPVEHAHLMSTAAIASTILYRDELEIPLIIQHAKGDPVARFNWSESLATGLDASGKPHRFYPYEGDEHMFRGKRLEQAIDRDSDFFWRLMPSGH